MEERKKERLFDSKFLCKVVIPYSRCNKVEFTLIKRTKEEKKRYILSVVTSRRLVDIPGYEKEWGIGKIKYFTIWKNFREDGEKLDNLL